jgi:NADPH:quinone reductase-like Zn-dependent oxidoreductase
MNAMQMRGFGVAHLTLAEVAVPQPGPHEVLVRLEAVALNAQDLLLMQGGYIPDLVLPHIPTSDGAGVVAALGADVTDWQLGDRVLVHFMQDWLSGPLTRAGQAAMTGLTRPGVLAEYAVLPATALVRIPDYLPAVEAATLPIAGLTAWTGLIEHGQLRPGQTVLTQGTGGVSIAALQVAKLAGARVIATTSQDAKLDRLLELGADEVLNYRTHPNWVAEVRRLTDGEGVDIALDVAGGAALAQSMQAVRLHGIVPFVGLLASPQAQLDVFAGLTSFVRLQGYQVGSRASLEQYVQALAQQRIRPVVDRVFPLAETQAAFQYLASGQQVGKVVITLN